MPPLPQFAASAEHFRGFIAAFARNPEGTIRFYVANDFADQLRSLYFLAYHLETLTVCDVNFVELSSSEQCQQLPLDLATKQSLPTPR
jgi:hypothetical protein